MSMPKRDHEINVCMCPGKSATVRAGMRIVTTSPRIAIELG